jgi:enoyl-CoA hydratase
MTRNLKADFPIPGVLLLTLARPRARNALDTVTLRALTAAVRDADGDDRVVVMVLTGEDPTFCAGLDLKELATDGGNLTALKKDPDADPFTAMRLLHKPLIGAVNGPAITGGLELALGCDFLIASERARFADTHGTIGVVPGGGMTALLPQAIGLRKAREMSFTGRSVDAREALLIGLVNHVVPHDRLLATTFELCDRILVCDAKTVTGLKRAYIDGARGTLAECLATEQRTFRAWPFDFDQLRQRATAHVSHDRGVRP